MSASGSHCSRSRAEVDRLVGHCDEHAENHVTSNDRDAAVEEYDRLAPHYDRRWTFYIEATLRETLKRLDVRPGDSVCQAKHKDDRLSRWVTGIAQRRHPNVAAVALANKTVRMAWAMMRNETDYDPGFVVT